MEARSDLTCSDEKSNYCWIFAYSVIWIRSVIFSAEAFMKLPNLLYHCSTTACLVSSTIPETCGTETSCFIDMICKGNWAAFSSFELSSWLCYVHLFQTPPSSSCPLLVDINNHIESLINAQGWVLTVTLSWLLIGISQYLSLNVFCPFSETLLLFKYDMFWHATNRNCVGFNIFLRETI